MFSIKTNYIILIWIIILILFTFFCVFRLGYMREKYYDVSQYLQKTTQPNIISYINNIQSKTDITDMPGCTDMYDDNFTVQSLGYNDCQAAYSDYLAKNLDTTNKYGLPQSLIEICPVSSKSEKYSQCLQSLMSTFTDNANILDTITSDMNTSINKRVVDRNTAITGIETAINPFIYSKSQADFNNNMKMNGQFAKYKDDTLGLVNSYYQNRYKSGKEGFANVLSTVPASSSSTPSQTLSNLSTLVLDSQLIDNFFGVYQAVKGQFISLDNLKISLGYDTSNQSNPNSLNTITINNITEVIPPEIVLTIDNGNLIINYTVNNLENYNALSNAIKLNLTEKNIIADTSQFQYQQEKSIIVQQLLTILGINVPARIIMTYEDFTSTENIKHRSYKLVNDNLDTILVLEKI